MKRKKENLILALAKFAEDWWLPYDDSKGMLDNAISNGMIDKESLTKDFLDAINDNYFDWQKLAKESQLLITPEYYNDTEVKNYTKALLMDFLFPEKAISEEERKMLIQNIELILKNYTDNDGWMFSYDIFNRLKENEAYKNLEYYHLRNARNEHIELKFENEFKEIELGFWRYKQ